MLKRLLIPLLILAFAILFSAPDVLACSCLAKPTVLDEFARSEIVVTTRLASVEKVDDENGEFYHHGVRSTTMIVTKVFKGNVRPGQALKFAQGGGGDCVWLFKEEWIGNEFLFYLGKPSKGHPWMPNEMNGEELMYHAFECGRSNGLKHAIDDLAYLENLDKVRGKTRLSGRFAAWFDGFTGSDIKLKIAGKAKTYDAKTDKNGFFEVYDLLPGEYVVTVDLPFGWKLNDYMLRQTSTGYEEYDPRGAARSKNQIPVIIKKGGHTALDLVFDIDSAIKGRVVSPSGSPMDGVCVKAVSTELKEGDYRGQFNCTDKNGEFSIEEMRRGNYILVANDDGRMSRSNPFGVVFFPGVTEYKNAAVVAVEPGKYVTGRVIQIPQTVELVTLRGRFLFSDGKPVVNESIKFVPNDKERFDEMREETDASGAFVFQLPKGAVGKISGEMWTYIGQFQNCPKLEAIIKDSGEKYHTIKSSVDVSSLEPLYLIEIMLPFPYCEKVKE